MKVRIEYTFKRDKKEPFADAVERVHGAFAASEFGAPSVEFFFSAGAWNAPDTGVDHLMEKYPELRRFFYVVPGPPDTPGSRVLSNAPRSPSPARGEAAEFATLFAAAAGVRKPFRLDAASFRFRPRESDGDASAPTIDVIVSESRFVDRWDTMLMALVYLDGDPDDKRLSPPPAIAGILAALGNAPRRSQKPAHRRPTGEEIGAAIAVHRDYQSRLGEIVDRAQLPHDLPASEPVRAGGLSDRAGQKAMLRRAFGPLGYDCTFSRNDYMLRRRKRGNVVVVLRLDVGWEGRTLSIHYVVSFSAQVLPLHLPVSKRAIAQAEGEYGIRDDAHWQEIVDNLAALVAELDRTFVPAIEAAIHPWPEAPSE